MGRLFWKIFLWFLLALVLLGAALVGSIRFSTEIDDEHETFLVRTLTQRLNAIATIMEHGGPDVVRDFLSKSESMPLRVWVLDADNKDLVGRRSPLWLRLADPARLLSREVHDAQGNTYQLVIYRPIAVERRLSRGAVVSSAPGWMPFAVILLLGASACAWLAWYISRPVRLLQSATLAMSDGTRRTPIIPKLGRRHDELADLARAFDSMSSIVEANQLAQKQLINDISHELRSPLTRLRLQIGLLEKQLDVEQVQKLERMDKEVSRLDELVEQVLTMARMETFKDEPLQDYVDLVVLLGELTRAIELEAKAKDCHLQLVCTPSELVISASKELLRRAIENVLRNAVQHSVPGSTISACLNVYPDNCEISVQDGGEGVEPALLESIFEPFFRADPSRKAKQGVGLGLAIAKRAVNLHRGSISARNHEQGGLTVTIRLPLVD
ncbi:MAG: HAMP domain-containing histidine kinase [Candidatus Thiodiazotropha sp. (ex Monitilora ramsayi)]|nr:HAMP domain-containing histidine kinase [Candidatus Thiodiazotropha sp. (ex Monitilora ramsayi)]